MSDLVNVVSSTASSATFVPSARAAVRRVEVVAASPVAPEARDRVELSSRPAETSEEKVARVKNQLREGTYLAPDKLDIAVERLAKDLGFF